MDNKAYLDEIAVKGKRQGVGAGILSPMLIKLIIVALFAVIALAVVGNIISGENTKTTQLYERVYARVAALADKKGPYQNYLNSSDLRAFNVSALGSLETTRSTLASAAKGVNIDVKNITPSVKSEENGIISSFKATLDDARLQGTLDATFAQEAAYQISMLIALEQEVRAKITDANFASALDASIADLTLLQENYADWQPIQ